ncbi:MAG TPA: c-type cytochrome [Steroidobacteraceae bacterium]|nr:c-type cytochrome [Steroidobacteraceae bacterium]
MTLPSMAKPSFAIYPTLMLCMISAALAQNGDRAGEVQNPLPSHLQSPPAPALSPADAAKTFKLPPGFHVELVASEPLVFDPVAMSIGPDGRLWVVEMRAFMRDINGTGENAPIGTVAVLEDSNGDGRMDKRTEFAGGLVMPRAVSLVANGVLVAEPPNLWFLEDTNHDGKADKRTQVAKDYGDATNPEHTANGLMWAMDNWIYSANHTTRFRYDPKGTQGQWRRERTVFRGQWGITQDDVGRLYHNNNSEPLRMDVLPAEYLQRNPKLVAPDSVNFQLAKPQDTPVWPGRITLGVNRGYKTLRDDGTLPQVTAACGPVIYRGAAFPRAFHGDAFIAEPSANLIKRLEVSNAGLPSVRNAYEHAEFLTSTDERFRPVNLYNGPDGALYVVDRYHGIIQHRIYLTTYLRNQIQERGLDAPVGLGRIWRIVADRASRHARPDLAKASSRKLVAALSRDEGWWRDTAQRLLVERHDLSVAPALELLARNAPGKFARLHALWTLEGLNAVDWPTVQAALADIDVDVAVAGARLSERFFPEDPVRVAGAIATRIKAGEPAFLRQAALSLGAGPAQAVDDVLAQLALRHGALPFMADALVSSWNGREAAALQKLSAGGPGARAVAASLSAALLHYDDAAQVDALFARLASKDSPPWLVEAILDGVDRFIPGEGDRRRTAFLPQEPKALAAFARTGGAQAARATEDLKYLRWRGQQVDEATALATLSDAERKRFERGRAEFQLCAACHQPQGQGLAGLAPPLVGSPWVNGGTGAVVRIVLQGKTDGEMTMPPLASLDDDKIAAILTFVRRSWGHEATPVTAGEVQAVRSETKFREEPWTEADLAAFN